MIAGRFKKIKWMALMTAEMFKTPWFLEWGERVWLPQLVKADWARAGMCDA